MTASVFVDSNVLLYAHDPESGEKQATAAKMLDELWAAGTGVLSTQVLEEFYVNVTRKLRVRHEAARELVRLYARWNRRPIEPADIFVACELEQQSKINFWDALIVAMASKAEAAKLLTEDLQHGRTILGVRIENPFKA